ncbi:MAG: hypothetical protein AB7P52_04865 [Alphaproteobacteria bacterium]
MIEPNPAPVSFDERHGEAPAIQLIDRRFEVDVGRPLPAFDSPHAIACMAHDRDNPRASLFALVVAPGIAWRGAAIQAQLAIRHPSVLHALTVGPVMVPGASRRQAAIILERPHGARLSTRQGGFKERQLCEFVLPALLDGLQALHEKGITHRALRPDNIFFLSGREDALTIGECFSAPPGHDQPDDFEPIERAAALPEGRGEGTPACDMYALGLTLARLLDAAEPPPEDPTQRLIRRMERGSFATVVGRLNCSASMRELIAGLMVDDPTLRWTIDDVRAWLLNPRAPAPSVIRPRDGTRPYTIQGQVVTQPRALARLYAQSFDVARQDLFKGNLVRWLRSSYGHRELADAVERLVGRVDDMARGKRLIDEELVSRVGCLLDPAGPITYGGLSVMMDGMAGALAQAALVGNAEAIKTLVGMLELGLPQASIGSPLAPEAVREQEASFTSLRNRLRSKYTDNAVERALYSLNPQFPCLSPMVHDMLPIGPARYLRALDRFARSGRVFEARPVDAHGEAYISAHLPAELLKRARAIGIRVRPPANEAVGDLAVLAAMQYRFDAGPLPHLARWLAERVAPAFDGVHNAERRVRLVRGLKNKAHEGDLDALLEALLDPREQRADNAEYRKARARYVSLGLELEALSRAQARRAVAATMIGRRIAAAVGGVVFAGASLFSLLGLS